MMNVVKYTIHGSYGCGGVWVVQTSHVWNIYLHLVSRITMISTTIFGLGRFVENGHALANTNSKSPWTMNGWKMNVLSFLGPSASYQDLIRNIVSVDPIWPMRLIYLPTNLPKKNQTKCREIYQSHGSYWTCPFFCFKIQNFQPKWPNLSKHLLQNPLRRVDTNHECKENRKVVARSISTSVVVRTNPLRNQFFIPWSPTTINSLGLKWTKTHYSMAILRSAGLKVGYIRQIPRSTQRDERSGVRRSPKMCQDFVRDWFYQQFQGRLTDISWSAWLVGTSFFFNHRDCQTCFFLKTEPTFGKSNMRLNSA